MYVNVYRQTNHADVGMYFESEANAKITRRHLMMQGSKETLHDYVPGEWRDEIEEPFETEDIKGPWRTLKLQYPDRADPFFDLSHHMEHIGTQYHNTTDIMRQYAIEGAEKVQIVVIGQSPQS